MSPGARIKMLRIVLGLSRETFCARHNININTLTSIEIDRLKLSSKQLSKLKNAFEKEGLYVEPLWIKDAKGPAPTRFLAPIDRRPWRFLEDWAASISRNKDFVMTQVRDDSMEPFYFAGDLVGGFWSAKVEELLGKRCIVDWSGRFHLGALFCAQRTFFLAPANTKSSNVHISFQSPPARVAEVLWHIRKEAHPVPELAALEGCSSQDIAAVVDALS